MQTVPTQMSDEQAVHLVRNALLVAGTEMGADGDHWPVIKSTVHSVMKDYENLKIERNVFDEVRTHFQSMIKELEVLCNESPDTLKPEIQAAVIDLLDIYNASFSPTSEIYIDMNDVPAHIKRAEAILKTLEDDHE